MKKILVCTNFRSNPQYASCAARGSALLLTKLSLEFDPGYLTDSPCMGFCDVGPNIRLSPNGAHFHEVSVEKLEALLPEIQAFIVD